MRGGCRKTPGGFGLRGVEGKILAIRHARENGIPFLGLCLGLQSAVIEFSRNVLGLSGAHSTEFDPTATDPVIALMEEQEDVEDMGLFKVDILGLGALSHLDICFDLLKRHRGISLGMADLGDDDFDLENLEVSGGEGLGEGSTGQGH